MMATQSVSQYPRACLEKTTGLTVKLQFPTFEHCQWVNVPDTGGFSARHIIIIVCEAFLVERVGKKTPGSGPGCHNVSIRMIQRAPD